MELCVLGRIAVVVDGAELVLGATREAALLADLVVHAGQVVSAGRLIEDIWRGEPPPGAAATLQTYVKNLRRMLEPHRAAGRPSDVLVSRRPGYLLQIEPQALDARRCERLVDEGRAALHAVTRRWPPPGWRRHSTCGTDLPTASWPTSPTW